jgi:hypothetical protein
MNKIAIVLWILGVVGLLASGCTGGARQVESCYDCNENANWRATEYCVEGQGDQLYCANPCLSDVDCDVDFWCVPLVDQGTPYDDTTDLRWVCMPSEYYFTDSGRVWRTASDCENSCPGEMTCIVDNSGVDDIFFCSDECLVDSDCLSDCCATSTEGDFCAPYYPYCES